MNRSVFARGAGAMIVGSAALGMATGWGCSAPMLSPVYTPETVTTDTGLVGTWVHEGDARMQAVVTESAGQRYEAEFTLWDEGKEKTRLRLEARLVRLGDVTYADLYLSEEERSALVERYGLLVVPAHQVVRYARNEDTLDLRMIDWDWLGGAIKEGMGPGHWRMKEADDEMIVLTASTPDLQKFLVEHGADPKAFGEAVVFRRTKP